MKYFYNILLIFGVFVFIACEKHEVEYDTVSLNSEISEFQIHYVVPINAVPANNITKIEINDQLLTNSTAILGTYNSVPSGRVGRFFTTKVGDNNIKLYMNKNSLVYDQVCTFTRGKQNVFVYDFNKPPIVFDNEYPYTANVTEHSDSTAWVKFYNFFYEKKDTPSDLKLQYQYQYVKDYNVKPNLKSDWINLGKPIAFGETTGWQSVVINKTVVISEGTAQLGFRIKVIDADGTDLGELQVLNSADKYVNYSEFKTCAIGRRYHHILSGMRADKPVSSVRTFTAL